MKEQINLTQLQDFCKENSIDIACLFEDDRDNEKQVIIDKFGACEEIGREFILDDVTDDELRTIIESVIYFPSQNLYVKELSFKTFFISTSQQSSTTRKYFAVTPEEKTITVFVEKQ